MGGRTLRWTYRRWRPGVVATAVLALAVLGGACSSGQGSPGAWRCDDVETIEPDPASTVTADAASGAIDIRPVDLEWLRVTPPSDAVKLGLTCDGFWAVTRSADDGFAPFPGQFMISTDDGGWVERRDLDRYERIEHVGDRVFLVESPGGDHRATRDNGRSWVSLDEPFDESTRRNLDRVTRVVDQTIDDRGHLVAVVWTSIVVDTVHLFDTQHPDADLPPCAWGRVDMRTSDFVWTCSDGSSERFPFTGDAVASEVMQLLAEPAEPTLHLVAWSLETGSVVGESSDLDGEWHEFASLPGQPAVVATPDERDEPGSLEAVAGPWPEHPIGLGGLVFHHFGELSFRAGRPDGEWAGLGDELPGVLGFTRHQSAHAVSYDWGSAAEVPRISLDGGTWQLRLRNWGWVLHDVHGIETGLEWPLDGLPIESVGNERWVLDAGEFGRLGVSELIWNAALESSGIDPDDGRFTDGRPMSNVGITTDGRTWMSTSVLDIAARNGSVFDLDVDAHRVLVRLDPHPLGPDDWMEPRWFVAEHTASDAG